MTALVLATVLTFAHARTIEATVPATGTNIRVIVPQAIDGGNDATYPDLRVVDSSGHEIPYALDPTSDQPQETLAISDVGFVPGSFTQAIVDYGPHGALHDALTIHTSRATYFERVSVETSDDRRTWARAASDALIYAVAGHDAGSQTVEYAPSLARYVRVRVLDATRAFPIDGATAASAASTPVTYPLAHRDTIAQENADTVVDIDTGSEHTDISGIAIATATREFSRSVTVSDVGTQTDAPAAEASGTLSRYATGTPQLSIDAPMRARRIRLRIANGNDAPLQGLVVTVYGHQHAIVFTASPQERYRLAWGASLDAPAYDLRDRLAHQRWSARTATLGPATAATITLENQNATGTLVKTYALPVALVVVLAVLALVVFSTLRAKPAAEHVD